MRRYASFLLVVAVTACGSLQSVAVTPQQRLFAAYGDYIVYGQIVLQAVEDPLTLPETKAALKEGMNTLRGDGWLKAIAGDTSIDEVLRVTKSDKVFEVA